MSQVPFALLHHPMASFVRATMQCWSLSVAHALSTRPHKPRWYNSSRFLNYHFVLGGPIFVVTIITLACVTSHYYDRMLADFGIVQDTLGELGAQFAMGGMSRDAAEDKLRAVAPLLQHQFDWISLFIPWFRAMWAFFALIVVYVYAVRFFSFSPS